MGLLPIYEALSFQRVMDGGRTNPWLILVNENGIEKPYVVKLFNEIENDRREVICKEVLGNLLANEFGLLAPKPALIDMDYSFETTINDPNAFFQYEYADQRVKFATEYISPSYQFIFGGLTAAQTKRAIPIDTLFAFDNLIRNSDRGQARTNILMQSKRAFVIDHELAFNIDSMTFDNIMAKNWDLGIYKRHIVYEFLRRSKRQTKKNYFFEFEEYLRFLNVNEFAHNLKQLNNQGYRTINSEYVLEYLDRVRKNSGNFVQLLQGII